MEKKTNNKKDMRINYPAAEKKEIVYFRRV